MKIPLDILDEYPPLQLIYEFKCQLKESPVAAMVPVNRADILEKTSSIDLTMVFGPRLYYRGTMEWQLCLLETAAGILRMFDRNFWT